MFKQTNALSVFAGLGLALIIVAAGVRADDLARLEFDGFQEADSKGGRTTFTIKIENGLGGQSVRLVWQYPEGTEKKSKEIKLSDKGDYNGTWEIDSGVRPDKKDYIKLEKKNPKKRFGEEWVFVDGQGGKWAKDVANNKMVRKER